MVFSFCSGYNRSGWWGWGKCKQGDRITSSRRPSRRRKGYVDECTLHSRIIDHSEMRRFVATKGQTLSTSQFLDTEFYLGVVRDWSITIVTKSLYWWFYQMWFLPNPVGAPSVPPGCTNTAIYLSMNCRWRMLFLSCSGDKRGGGWGKCKQGDRITSRRRGSRRKAYVDEMHFAPPLYW